jgi:glycosyltransferase involved in cell wall biosynthesis
MTDFRPALQNGLRISCIICTYNRVGLLDRVLQGLLAQTLPRTEFEVVLVDDGSTEDVGSLVNRYRKMLPINYIRQENSGLGAARNTGVATSRAPILLFMDDDDVPAPSLLAEHLHTHETQPEARVAVLGHTNLHPEIANRPLMQFVTDVGCYLFSYGRIANGAILDYTWFWGGRSSCKRCFLPAVQPFNPLFRFGCEDIELGYRLSLRGLRVVYNQSAVTTMLRAFTVDEFCRRSESQGRSNWLFSRLHAAPEVAVWAHVEDAERRWRALRPKYQELIQAARHLDSLAQARTDHRIEIDSEATELLHRAYWSAFDAARLKGIVSAAGETVPIANHESVPTPVSC